MRKRRALQKDCKSKIVEKRKGFNDASYIEAKTSSNEVGDVYLPYSITHVDHEAWLIDLGASFHMTSHREWFCEYEVYYGSDVLLEDDLKDRIIE